MCPHIRPGTLKIKMLPDHSEYIQMRPGLHYDSIFYYKCMKSNYKLKGCSYIFRTLGNSRYGSFVNNTDVILQMMNRMTALQMCLWAALTLLHHTQIHPLWAVIRGRDATCPWGDLVILTVYTPKLWGQFRPLYLGFSVADYREQPANNIFMRT